MDQEGALHVQLPYSTWKLSALVKSPLQLQPAKIFWSVATASPLPPSPRSTCACQSGQQQVGRGAAQHSQSGMLIV